MERRAKAIRWSRALPLRENAVPRWQAGALTIDLKLVKQPLCQSRRSLEQTRSANRKSPRRRPTQIGPSPKGTRPIPRTNRSVSVFSFGCCLIVAVGTFLP